jgi:hypothetical protein
MAHSRSQPWNVDGAIHGPLASCLNGLSTPHPLFFYFSTVLISFTASVCQYRHFYLYSLVTIWLFWEGACCSAEPWAPSTMDSSWIQKCEPLNLMTELTTHNFQLFPYMKTEKNENGLKNIPVMRATKPRNKSK